MTNQPPKPHEPENIAEQIRRTLKENEEFMRRSFRDLNSKPKRTRLIEAVECGLSKEDRETVDDLQWAARSSEEEIHILSDDRRARALDLLDRLPRMVEDRDRELADAEYQILCLQLEVDTIRNHNADLILRAQDRRHFRASDDEAIQWRRMYERQVDLTGFQRIEIARLRGLLDGESHG